MQWDATGCYLYSEVINTVVSFTVVISNQSVSFRDYFITWMVKYSTFSEKEIVSEKS